MARRTRPSGLRDRYPTAALALALVAAGAAFPALAQGPVTAPALSAPATVSWDAEGIPLIQGSHDNDVAFLQGWAHARDRFFQMDLTRRSASGTLAELVGASVLQDDVQARTIGLRRAAARTWNAMDADTRGWIKAYADGVNFWLAGNDLPPEYGALELSRAQSWDPVDTVVIGKALAFQLSFDLDIEPTLKFAAYQQAGAAEDMDPGFRWIVSLQIIGGRRRRRDDLAFRHRAQSSLLNLGDIVCRRTAAVITGENEGDLPAAQQLKEVDSPGQDLGTAPEHAVHVEDDRGPGLDRAVLPAPVVVGYVAHVARTLPSRVE